MRSPSHHPLALMAMGAIIDQRAVSADLWAVWTRTVLSILGCRPADDEKPSRRPKPKYKLYATDSPQLALRQIEVSRDGTMQRMSHCIECTLRSRAAVPKSTLSEPPGTEALRKLSSCPQ